MTGLRRLKLIQSASIGGILLLVACGASAAPLCSEVLRDPTTMSQTILNLAKLKMDADLNQTQGSEDSLGTHMVHAQFDKKLSELLESISNQSSRAEATAQIKKEIARLQGSKEEVEQNREKDLREETRVIRREKRINDYPIKFVNRVDLQGPILAKDITYSEVTNSIVLMNSDGTLLQYGTKDGSKTVIAPEYRSFTITADQKYLLVMISENDNAFLMKYDLLKKTEVSRVPAPELELSYYGLDLSPNQSTLLSLTPKIVKLVDPSTGQLLKKYKPRGVVESVKFINDDAVMIQTRNRLIRWNWKTNRKTTIPVKEHARKIHFNPDRSLVTIIELPKDQTPVVVQYATQNFKEVYRSPLQTQQLESAISATPLPNDPDFIIYTTVTSGLVPFQQYKIAHKRDLNFLAFDFGNVYGPKLPQHQYRIIGTSPGFSRDGNQILINIGQNKNTYIDIWQVVETSP